LANLSLDKKRDFISGKLKPTSAKIMAELPDEIEKMLLLDRDSHGNLQVSKIPTELLLIQMTELKIMEMQNHAEKYVASEQLKLTQEEIEKFKKFKFNTNSHFFGYEGRCGAPSKFDANYCFNLGLTAGSLICDGKNGYMAIISDIGMGGKPMAIPLASLLQVERRHGQDELVIEKALVKMDSPAFKYFAKRRDEWAKNDLFCSPGPRQIWGPIANQLPLTVILNQSYPELTYKLG
jgi:pyrophosphate--fructose-6-phosphate 1-phosphotransferase